MKTKEELNTLKQEFESLTNKLQELTDDELKLVIGGTAKWVYTVGGALVLKESSASTMLQATQSTFEELPEE